MSAKSLLAVLCLLAGVALAAFGLSRAAFLLALLGFVLLLVFFYFASQWVNGVLKANEKPIRPASNPASAMRDEPVRKDSR
jgi:hypothetical protein